jgi:hypothetical protein
MPVSLYPLVSPVGPTVLPCGLFSTAASWTQGLLLSDRQEVFTLGLWGWGLIADVMDIRLFPPAPAHVVKSHLLGFLPALAGRWGMASLVPRTPFLGLAGCQLSLWVCVPSEIVPGLLLAPDPCVTPRSPALPFLRKEGGPLPLTLTGPP